MKYQVHLVLLGIFALVKPNYGFYGGRIPSNEEFPFAAKIVFHCAGFISGSIVHSQYAMTTATFMTIYRFIDPIPDGLVDVQVGGNSPSLLGVKKVFIEPQYNEASEADRRRRSIALLKLKKPIEISKKLKPIPLGFDNSWPGQKGVVVSYGYGKEKKSYFNAIEVTLDWCTKWKKLPDRMCTKTMKGISGCSGDVGAPVVVKGKQVGLKVLYTGDCEGDESLLTFVRLGPSEQWIKSTLLEK